MKRYGLLAVLLVCGCQPSEDPSTYGDVSASFLRDVYVEIYIEKYPGYDFDEAMQVAVETFPDGEYIAHKGTGIRRIDGYKHHYGMDWQTHSWQVYRKHDEYQELLESIKKDQVAKSLDDIMEGKQ